LVFGLPAVAMRTTGPASRLAAVLVLLAGACGNGTDPERAGVREVAPGADGTPMAYGRIVPEREDDFAWENDKVAFRVYGPTSRGQGPVSGVDAWFKKVSYPIIDKWYAEHLQQNKSYHVNHGEGYDVFHVGSSRGVGGTAVWVRGAPYPAPKFEHWEVHRSGGEMVEFTLRYAWETPLGAVTEQKRISLALGNRLYSVDSVFTLNGRPASVPIAIGLTTHDGAAEWSAHEDVRWISTWEVIDGYGVGAAALLDGGRPRRIAHTASEEKDAGHIWLVTDSDEEGTLAFRAGFAWQADGDITSSGQWKAFLDAAASGG